MFCFISLANSSWRLPSQTSFWSFVSLTYTTLSWCFWLSTSGTMFSFPGLCRMSTLNKANLSYHFTCFDDNYHNPSLGLATKVRAYKGAGQKRGLGVSESVRINTHTPKWTSIIGSWSPSGLLKLQRVIARVKTPLLVKFFMSLESYWNLDVQNGLVWPIWTFVTQVMAKRKVESQIGNLIPDHRKLGIDLIPLRAGGMQCAIGKFLTRATTSV